MSGRSAADGDGTSLAVGEGQLELLRAATRGRRPRPPEPPAADRPVARVVVDVPLPHLDRTFDYAVPAGMADAAQPGTRVRVRFAGQDVDGFIVDRADSSDHSGPLTRIRRVVSPEPVLSPQVLRLARTVADAYAGTLTDVLRLAVPPRHAAAERAPRPEAAGDRPGPVREDPVGPWRDYPAGPALLTRLAAGESPRAVWTALPGPAWAPALAAAVAATLASGRGALIVLPDRRDVDSCETALTDALGPGRHSRLEADLGPAARYRAFLALRRGDVRVAVGTRAAAFAPVPDLGLVAIWDDGDDLHVEPRAPYPHAREVLARRAELENAAMIVGGWSRTAECAAWLRDGWARPVVPERVVLRARRAAVSVAASAPGADDDPAAAARVPGPAWRAIGEGLRRGAVLVQVPRAGYVPGLACQSCRRSARCPACHGPVVTTGEGPPGCRWCGRSQAAWTCPHCGGRRLRARTVGVLRTAEELGRGFPGTPVVVPRAGAPTPAVPGAALVVATPGLEPPADEGYAAAVLLDGWVLLERPDLRAAEDALRRWSAATALVRPGPDGGRVVLCVDPQAAAAQALVRGDPGWHAERELDERTRLGLPPAVAMATLTGEPAAVRRFVALLATPDGVDVLGPIPVGSSGRAGDEPGDDDGTVRMVLRAPSEQRAAMVGALRVAAATRSARREQGSVRIQVDPWEVG